MDFFRQQQPLTEDEIRHRMLELQRQIDRCRKQLELAECELALLADDLRTSQLNKPGATTIVAGRLAGL